MSHKRIREATLSKNLSVASKCLAIVLISKGKKDSQDVPTSNHEWDDTVVDTTDGNVIVQSSEVQKALSPNGYNGKELLQDFKIRNTTCYWNPSLVESIKSLEYKGFVEPSTILVSGGDIHIENIRSAWGRRVLKPPAGFVIERIGDVNGIQMQEIPQTQFMPLPDALCSVIMELNVQRVVATLDVILDKLSVGHRDMTLPDQQVIVDILGALIKDRKVFHTGSGYFVVTPDTNRLPNGPSSNTTTYMPTNASWLPYHPMYVPVFQGQAGPPLLPPGPPVPPSRSHMRSISCQVTTIEETESEGEDEREKVAKVGGGGGGNKGSTLTRASRQPSFRQSNKSGKDSKQTGEKEKENNKNGPGGKGGKGGGLEDGKATKVKEKTSLLSKLFGRNKKKSNNAQQQQQQNQQLSSDTALMPPPALPPPPPYHPIPIPITTTGKSQTTATDNGGGGGEASKSLEPQEKEYATFSAQFPPAEWAWYQQQLEKQKRTETWVTHQSNSSKATVALPTNRQTASSTLSRRPPQGSNDRHGRKSLMPLTNHHVDYLSMNDVMGQKTNPIPLASLQYDGEFLKPDNLYESFRHNTNNPHSSKQRQRNSHHRKSRDLDYIGEENAQPSTHPKSHYRDHHHQQYPSHHHNGRHKRSSDYDVIDQGDTTPINGSNVYHSVSGLSPVSLFSDESTTYAKLAERHQHHPNLGPLHSTPRYSANGPGNGLHHGRGERGAFKLEGHESRDRIYGGGPSEFSHSKRRSQRSRRRNHRAYSFYSGNGDDISIEYKGRLPNKNSSRVQSRDSGVNCMGLGKNGANPGKKQETPDLYENTPASKKHPFSKKLPHNNQGPRGDYLKESVDSNHVHFDINNLTCATDSMAIDPYASTASVAYQSEVTNPAFSSVVYGSSPCTTTGNMADNESTLGPIGSSVMYQTITNSALEPSEIVGPQPSPQSGFYEDGSCSVSAINPGHCPGGEVVTIQAEITQGDTEEYIDVEGETIPDIREVAGSSNGMLEIAAEEEDEDNVTKVGGLCDGREGGVGVSIGHDDGDDDDDGGSQEIDVEGFGGNGGGQKCVVEKCGEDGLDIADREGDGKPSQCVDSNNRIMKDVNKVVKDGVSHNKLGELKQINGLSSTTVSNYNSNGKNIAPVDKEVADSGFSSPRNPETAPPSSTSSSSSSSDPRCQMSGQSQSLSDHSSGDNTNTGHAVVPVGGDGHHTLPEDTTTTEGSDGHHTHSEDIHMATSSEHHSGSTNDNGEIHSEDSSSVGGEKQSQYHHDYYHNNQYNHHHHHQQQIVKYRPQSSHHSGGSSCSSSHSYPYHHNHHRQTVGHPPPALPLSAKVITHPDVFNNNASTLPPSYSSDQEQQLVLHRPQLVPVIRGSSSSNSVYPTTSNSLSGWPSNSTSQKTASQLHLFEEEQRAKNYGGDFEVMGVL